MSSSISSSIYTSSTTRPPPNIRVGSATPIASPSTSSSYLPLNQQQQHQRPQYSFSHTLSSSTMTPLATPHATPTPRIGSTSATPRTLQSQSHPPAVVDPFFGRILTPSEQAYIRDFTSWSYTRLEKEPRMLSLESQKLQTQLESLSLENYPTFLQTSTVLKQAEKSLKQIDRHMSEVHTHLVPSLQTHCGNVQDRSANFIQASDSHRNLLKHQAFLLELLEIPQLMDTCFKSATAPNTNEREKNKLINDALALDTYVKQIGEQYTRWIVQQSNEMAATAGDDLTNSGAAIELSATPLQPTIPPLLQSVQLELLSMKRNIVNHLLVQLRGNISATTEEEELDPGAIAEGKKPNIITIPEVVVSIRIVGLLKRTLELFGDATSQMQAQHGGGNAGATSLVDIHAQQDLILKYQFLIARNAYFESVVAALVPPPNQNGLPATVHPSSSTSTPHLIAFKYLDSYIALHRTNLFNITTLYSALFLDAEDASPSSQTATNTLADAKQQKQYDEIGLVCRWMHRRLEIMMETIESHLSSITDGASLSTLLSSCSSCALGLSRSKIGFDFRSLIVPVFEKRVREMLTMNLNTSIASFDHALTEYAWFIPSQNLRRLGLSVPKQAGNVPDTISTHLAALLPYPPLAILANGLVTAVNELAKCAPVTMAESSGSILQKTMESLIQRLKNLPQGTTITNASVTSSTAEGTSESLDPVSHLAHATHSHLLPLASSLFTHVYPSSGGFFSLPRLLTSISVMIASTSPEAHVPATAVVPVTPAPLSSTMKPSIALLQPEQVAPSESSNGTHTTEPMTQPEVRNDA